MTISTKDIFQRNPEIVASEIDNETVMMDTNFENYFGLKAIGTQVWQMLEQPISIEKIAMELVKTYDVSIDQCVEDLQPLFEDFIENEMIVKA